MKTRIYIIAMLLISAAGFSQQNAQYNHYIFNQLVLNPAYAGTKGLVNVNGIYASQWSGLDGAPTTQSVSIEGPVFNNIGLGLHLIKDEIGSQSNQGLFGSYAFRVKLTKKLKLSMGISTGVTYHSLDGTTLISENPDDPAIPMTLEKTAVFDSKIGMFLYSKRFYFGFSVTELTANIMDSYDMMVAGQIQHYYMTAGYVAKLSEDIKFKPSFLIKEDFKAPTNMDLNAFFLYKNLFWLGGTIRTGAEVFKNKNLDESLRNRDAIIVMTELNVTDHLRIGYAYTFTTSALKEYTGHEISLGYYFKPDTKSKMLTPRYF
ncbi:MAG: hypothetical protein A2W91_01915 [Bacteroidetes bacterium GWF2_38_335]|nr:MAG: hypothetical protein A2W91_01915 [Bacteroidetes bacterium GWF2_38_335]OFY80610.1 MAG: hypothetical protein A2281_04930 [Bacteroidetes bacterium RIFOXYA12_FULL_38_20]HBS86949.1 hypothetical protein [Bacteroidales bacterium]